MPYTVCVVPVMPLRAIPAHPGEMVTQVIFGECLEVTEAGPDGWVRVKCRYDGYEGWGAHSHLREVSAAFFGLPETQYAGDWVNDIRVDGQLMHIPLGCPISSQAEWEKEGLPTLSYQGSLIRPGENKVGEGLIRKYAFDYLNTPYLWGGRSPFGIDCSGFSQSVFKLTGIRLPRDAWQQALVGTERKDLKEGRCGDLAFFANPEGRVTHVGILLGAGEIIHAAGKVRVDKMTAGGIIHSETGELTHRLSCIRRYS